ncbi:MAG TPA: hypothetical protein VKB54_04320 [Solirubrobacteraceae bacterium]|nr:hypothetical protein [Solirubrobacteraceae bacterium]
MTPESTGARRLLGALVVVIAVACCVAAPAIAGLVGGAVLWSAGVPVIAAVAVLAGTCFAIARIARRRGRGRVC